MGMARDEGSQLSRLCSRGSREGRRNKMKILARGLKSPRDFFKAIYLPGHARARARPIGCIVRIGLTMQSRKRVNDF